MSALSHCVTCGTVAHVCAMRSAVIRRIVLSGCTSTSPHCEKSGNGAAATRAPPPPPEMMLRACAFTSSTETRPPGPDPSTVVMSTPSSRA